MKNKINQRGSLLMFTIVFAFIFIMIMGGILSLIINQKRLAKKIEAKEAALLIAEAGIEYYRWHLAHDNDNYNDGDCGTKSWDWCATSTENNCVNPNPCGPYQHTYKDTDSNTIGYFQLLITPPPANSTEVTIRSTGWVEGHSNKTRIIEAKYIIMPLTHYAFLTNSQAWFQSADTINGLVHSNIGIRMDGTNSAKVNTVNSTYICTERFGCEETACSTPCSWIPSTGCQCPGVWGNGSGSSLWEYPVAAIDFNTFSLDLAQLKTEAQNNGVYYGPSEEEGYRIIFQNNNTFKIYEVEEVEDEFWQKTDDWSAWEKKGEKTDDEDFITTIATPTDTVIFIEDDVWVEGTVSGRLTLAVGRFPENLATSPSIIINDNLEYVARDGNHVLGLIAQKNIVVPHHAPDILTIDAIMLAQNGKVFYNLAKKNPDRYIKTSIETYGSIISNGVWGWGHKEGGSLVDGYATTNFIYDNNATTSPPPFFPNVGEYVLTSWEEKIANES
jgi:hypothetical protein